jgi:hypothetical protein
MDKNMDDIKSVLDLSHKADDLLRALYKEYLGRRKSGINKSEAFAIGDIEYIRENLTPGLTHEEVDAASDELYKNNLIFKNLWGYVALKSEFLDFCEKNFIKV